MNKQVALGLTHDQKLLLQAALLSDEVALTYWQEWKATVDIDVLDHESYRLLPLLYRNLSSLGISDVDMGRLKGVYRRTWSENQLLFPDICKIIQYFDENEIKLVLLKDAALNLGYYPDWGVKMVSTIDFFVAPIDAIKAIILLQKIGWIAQREIPDKNFQYSHILGFKNKSRQYLNLRWRLFGDGFPKGAEQDFWDSIVLIDVGGVKIPVLSPTNQLLYSCAESTLGQPDFPFSHFADLAMIISTFEDKIDWKQLIKQAQKYRLILPVKNRLIQLNDILSIQLPMVQELNNIKASRLENQEYQLNNSYKNKLLARFWLRYFQYLKISHSANFFSNFFGFLNYLQYIWNLEHFWEIPGQIMLRSIMAKGSFGKLNSARESMMMTQPEVRVLLICATTKIDSAKVAQLKTLLHKNINWEVLLKMAKQHKVMPLLYSNLKKNCLESIPNPILNQLKSQFQVNTRKNLLLTGELIRLLKLFEDKEIPALPFKGSVLATSAYCNLSLRQFSDIDILFHQRDILRATSLLISEGYENAEKLTHEQEIAQLESPYVKAYTYKNDKLGVWVEPHWKLRATYSSFPLNHEQLWESLTSVVLAGSTVLSLSPEDELLYLCLHGFGDRWIKLSLICDIAQLINVYQAMDWEKVMEQAIKLGCRRRLFLGLFLAKGLLETNLPEKVWKAILTDPLVKWLADWVCKRLFLQADKSPNLLDQALFDLGGLDLLQDRVRYSIDRSILLIAKKFRLGYAKKYGLPGGK